MQILALLKASLVGDKVKRNQFAATALTVLHRQDRAITHAKTDVIFTERDSHLQKVQGHLTSSNFLSVSIIFIYTQCY